MSYCRINDESDVYVWHGGDEDDYFVSTNRDDPSDVAFTVHGLTNLQWLLLKLSEAGNRVPKEAFDRIAREIAQEVSGRLKPSEA